MRGLTYESAGKEGEAYSQRPDVAVPRLGDCHSVDSGHQHKGHDELPEEELAHGDGDPPFMGEAARHAVAATHMHPGNQDCLQTTTPMLV